jgi:hypothetical protein
MSSNSHRSLPAKRHPWLRILGAVVFLPMFLLACNLTAGQQGNVKTAEITWRESESPVFPSTWPPSTDTVWVRYTFAYGTNPSSLPDGVYVTRPLSRTEGKGSAAVKTVTLTQEMKQAGVQGIVPINDEAHTILDSEKQVTAYCLTLTGLPDPARPETKAMLAFYKTWFKFNGTFLNLVRDQHAAFIDWVQSSQ